MEDFNLRKYLAENRLLKEVSQQEIKQAKKEIEQTDFNDLFIQPAMEKGMFGMGVKDKLMVIRQLKKRVNEKIPTVISLLPDLVSGDTLFSIKVRLRDGQLLDGVTLGNLGPFIYGDRLTIDNDVAKRRLNKMVEDLRN